MSKEIDKHILEDGDVISVEAGTSNDGVKRIVLGLSHKCNEGSVVIWLSELKKLVKILEGEL